MKKFILVAIVLFYSFIGVNMVFATADTWTQKADFGGEERAFAVAFSIGNKGYLGGGYKYDTQTNSPVVAKDFWEYDPVADIWTQKADLLLSGALRLGFSTGSKGYVIFADMDNNIPFKCMGEYNPASNIWIQKSDYPGLNWAAGFSIGNKIYIGTGLSLEGSREFWEYDTDTDKWIRKADFGGPLRYHALGLSIGNKGYIGGGIPDAGGGSGAQSDFWEYDPSNDTWTQKADIGGVARQLVTGFSIGNKGYIYGGNAWDVHDVNGKDFWEYDPTFDTWRKKADFGGDARSMVAGFSIGNKGYIGTGLSIINYSNLIAWKDFWEYDAGNCTTAPVISSLTASPLSLWPPNNKMVAVTINAVVSSVCDPSPMTKIISVSSNEPANSDAVANGQAVITGNQTLKLLAQRNGKGSGRIYTITVQSTDSSGNTAKKTTTVVVPHDQGKN